MRSGLKLALAVALAGLAVVIYLVLRPPSPNGPPHSDLKELICMDEACGFRGVFRESEAIESVQQHGVAARGGIDFFHCPTCKRLNLYRSELAPLPPDVQMAR